MITTIILYILSFSLATISTISDFIARGWSPWPASVLDGLTYFFVNLMKFDFIFNIRQLLLAVKWVILFDLIYICVRLLMKLINWARGSGSIDV
jgi:hypothetical protein